MEIFVKSFDHQNEKFSLKKLKLECSRSLKFSTEMEASFYPNFVHRSQLLCVSSCEDDLLLLDNKHLQMALYNPTTEEVQLLPRTKIKARRSSGRRERYELHFSCSGLGKDYSNGDIKVIRQVSENRFQGWSCIGCCKKYELYSLRQNKWKAIKAPDSFATALLNPWGSVFVDGVYYWSASLDNDCPGIAAFHFSTERFFSIPRTPSTLEPFTFLVELQLQGHGTSSLGCFVYETSGESRQFELWYWSKEEELGQWVLMKTFSLEKVHRPVGFINGRFLFLEQIERGDRYYLKVYDVLGSKPPKSLKSLGLNDNRGYIQVVSYRKNYEHPTPLPRGARELRALNDDELYWDNYWLRIIEKEEEEEELKLQQEEAEEEEACSSSSNIARAFHEL